MIGKPNTLKALAKNNNTSAIADHVKTTGNNIKWDHFDILAKGKKDLPLQTERDLIYSEDNVLLENWYLLRVIKNVKPHPQAKQDLGILRSTPLSFLYGSPTPPPPRN